MRRAAATTAVISAIAIVGALGFGGVATARSNKALTKKQFIKQADKVCLAAMKQGNEIYARVIADYEGGDDAAANAAVWVEYGPVVQREVDDIRSLREPRADRKKVNKLLAAVQDALDTVTADTSVLSTSQPFAKADRLAQNYGFKICGSNQGE